MIQIGIIGSAGPNEYPKGSKPKSEIFEVAKVLGSLIAKQGAILITGGKGGIMESAAKGAKLAGGATVGIVKGDQRRVSNKFIDIEIVTNTNGEGEEDILVSSCDGIIVVGGGAGTLQELACAYRKRKPIIVMKNLKGVGTSFVDKYLDTRKLTKIIGASEPEKAIKLLWKML